MSDQRSPQRVREVRQVLIAGLVTSWAQAHITDQGRDVHEPKAYFCFEVGDHAYTVTITEDR